VGHTSLILKLMSHIQLRKPITAVTQAVSSNQATPRHIEMIA